MIENLHTHVDTKFRNKERDSVISISLDLKVKRRTSGQFETKVARSVWYEINER